MNYRFYSFSLAFALCTGSLPCFAGGIVSAEPVKLVFEKVCMVAQTSFPELKIAFVAIGRESSNQLVPRSGPTYSVVLHQQDGKSLRTYPSMQPKQEGLVQVFELKRYRSSESKTVGWMHLNANHGVMSLHEVSPKIRLRLRPCFNLNS